MSAKSTFQKVQGFIKTESLLDQAAGVVIALSGGPDSMVLLDILVRLQKALRKNRKHPQPIRLHIAHLNHRLRGNDSDGDAEFVRQLAEHLAIAATIAATDIKQLAEKTGKGIEESARQARYKFLLDTAIKNGCDRIATGHTMSDQAETFLMRLTRGTGLRGLASMRPAAPAHRFDNQSGVWSLESGVEEQNSEFSIQDAISIKKPELQSKLPTAYCLLPTEVKLVRPLLCITREEVEAYCRRRQLAYRVDATNQSLDYTRNRIRHEALKTLREINPRVIEHLAQTAEIVAADEAALEQWAKQLLGQAERAAPPYPGAAQRSAYAVQEIANYPLGVRRRILMAAIRQARAKFSLRGVRLSEIETAHVKAVEQLLDERASGNRVTLPDGLAVWREFDALVFTGAFNEASFHPYPSKQKELTLEVGGFRLTIKRRQNRALLKAIIEQTQHEKARAGVDWMTVALDDARLSETLIFRSRQSGEKVFVVGQRKIKKLKNIMIDHKIASSRRATWPVVATSDGQYVWSPGLPPAIKFAANDQTECLAVMHASNL